MKKIKLSFNAGRGYLGEMAIKAGLSEKAADYFKFADEVIVELEVEEDGQVVGGKLIEHPGGRVDER